MANNGGSKLDALDLQKAFEVAHPRAAKLFRDMLRQDIGQGGVMLGIRGDSAMALELAATEASILHPQGAVRIDCDGMNGRELLFATETHADGVKEGFGPLLKAMEAGQPVILENASKIKAGTSDMLQFVFMFLSGETKDLHLRNPLGNGEDFKMSQGDLGGSFRLRVTGLPEPAFDSNLPVSLQSRVRCVTIPQADTTVPAPKR